MRPPEDRQPSGDAPPRPRDADADAPPRPRQRLSLLSSPWLRAVLVLVFVIAADQVSKHAVNASIVQGEERKFLPGVELVNTRNNGVAFGFLPGSHVAVTIVIGLALVALLVYFTLHSREKLIWLPTGMLLGGAIGNVADRVRDGAVTDFVKLPLGWPPFNVADMAITFGVLILFLVIDHARAARRKPAQPS